MHMSKLKKKSFCSVQIYSDWTYVGRKFSTSDWSYLLLTDSCINNLDLKYFSSTQYMMNASFTEHTAQWLWIKAVVLSFMLSVLQ